MSNSLRIRSGYGDSKPRRIVEIWVYDPDHSVPAEQAILHHADRQLTELTDMELHLTLGLPALAKGWNKTRVTIRDLRYPESIVKLEPITPGELCVVIATIINL